MSSNNENIVFVFWFHFSPFPWFWELSNEGYFMYLNLVTHFALEAEWQVISDLNRKWCVTRKLIHRIKIYSQVYRFILGVHNFLLSKIFCQQIIKILCNILISCLSGSGILGSSSEGFFIYMLFIELWVTAKESFKLVWSATSSCPGS